MDMHRYESVTAGELYNRIMISKQDLQAEHAGEWAGRRGDGGLGKGGARVDGRLDRQGWVDGRINE